MKDFFLIFPMPTIVISVHFHFFCGEIFRWESIWSVAPESRIQKDEEDGFETLNPIESEAAHAFFSLCTLLSQVYSSQTLVHALFFFVPSAFSCPLACLWSFSNQAQHCFSSFDLSILVLSMLYRNNLLWCSSCFAVPYKHIGVRYCTIMGLFNHSEQKTVPLLGASKLALEDTTPQ